MVHFLVPMRSRQPFVRELTNACFSTHFDDIITSLKCVLMGKGIPYFGISWASSISSLNLVSGFLAGQWGDLILISV